MNTLAIVAAWGEYQRQGIRGQGFPKDICSDWNPNCMTCKTRVSNALRRFLKNPSVPIYFLEDETKI